MDADLPRETNRADLTDLYTVTIDPPGCKDIDDAISFKKKSSNLFELGVHIADVSHYVAKDDVIDKNARRRGTSFYSAATDTVYHMLPDRLSQDLCSLTESKLCDTLNCYFYNWSTSREVWDNRPNGME